MQRELAQRSGRDVSWVSRCLVLLSQLSAGMLQAVCAGRSPARRHARGAANMALSSSQWVAGLIVVSIAWEARLIPPASSEFLGGSILIPVGARAIVLCTSCNSRLTISQRVEGTWKR